MGKKCLRIGVVNTGGLGRRLEQASLLFQGGEHFGIANVHPAAGDRHAGEAMARGDHVIQRIGQCVLAARRFLQPRRELKQHGPKNVDAGVAPGGLAGFEPALFAQFRDLPGARLFHQARQAKFVVEQVHPALHHVRAGGDGDQTGELAFLKAPDHFGIGFGLDEDIAVGEEKGVRADEIFCQFRRLASAVLHRLTAIGNPHAQGFSAAKMVFNHLGPVAGHDENVPDAGTGESGQDVFEDRFALDLEHRFGEGAGEFSHARALAGGENDGFHQGRTLCGNVGGSSIFFWFELALRLKHAWFRVVGVRWTTFLAVLLMVMSPAPESRAASTKVIKVLPLYLDRQGRHALSPSLFDRDAYQAQLRHRPEERSGLRIDVQWKALQNTPLKLRVELRGGRGKEATKATLEATGQHLGGLSKWTSLLLAGEDYKKFGELVAWRATLWDGETLLAEQKSFLW